MWAHLSLGHLLIYKQIEFKSEILLSTSNESRKRLFLNFSQMWGGGLSQGFFQATSRKQAHFASFKFRGGSRCQEWPNSLRIYRNGPIPFQ